MDRTRLHATIAALLAASATLVAAGARAHGEASPDSRNSVRAANLDPVETSFGRTGKPDEVTRTIEVSGDDAMRYDPSVITVRRDETVRLLVHNTGKLDHELVIGTLAQLQEHAALMRKHPGMEHDEPFMAHVAPGGSAELIWKFTEPGEFHFGCLVPGHFEAGMAGLIRVKER